MGIISVMDSQPFSKRGPAIVLSQPKSTNSENMYKILLELKPERKRRNNMKMNKREIKSLLDLSVGPPVDIRPSSSSSGYVSAQSSPTKNEITLLQLKPKARLPKKTVLLLKNEKARSGHSSRGMDPSLSRMNVNREMDENNLFQGLISDLRWSYDNCFYCYHYEMCQSFLFELFRPSWKGHSLHADSQFICPRVVCPLCGEGVHHTFDCPVMMNILGATY